jgi:3-hydroxyisobutyrate dehydrogenase-like beta-hydroxyacid dehydrogenase
METTMSAKTASVSVIGTGRMGSALARAFLKGGHQTWVWNRTRSRCEPLAALGARVASTVEEAAGASDIAIVNVLDYPAGDRLLRTDAVTRALRGKLLVELASGTPDQARERAAWAAEHDIRYLDGAIMATPDLIGGPAAAILYAGPRDVFDAHRSALVALGGSALHVGTDAGHAAALDIALLAIMQGTLFGALVGIAVCEAEKLPLEAYMRSAADFTALVGGWALDVMKRARERDFGGETALATIEGHAAAVHHLVDVCRHHGIHRAVPDAFDTLLQAAVRAGHSGADFSVLASLMR